MAAPVVTYKGVPRHGFPSGYSTSKPHPPDQEIESWWRKPQLLKGGEDLLGASRGEEEGTRVLDSLRVGFLRVCEKRFLI